MNAYETALRESYKAFYEHPYKSEKMFDVMEEVADVVFHDTSNIHEDGWLRLTNKFYETFCNHAKTEDEKKAINSLLLLTIL